MSGLVSGFFNTRCPRCGGRLFVEQDARDIEQMCICCGYRKVISRDPRRSEPTGGNTSLQVGRFRGGKMLSVALGI